MNNEKKPIMMRYFAGIILLIINLPLIAQKQVGDWNFHKSYKKAELIYYNHPNLFCQTSSGIFVYNSIEKSSSALSTNDDFKNTDISSFCFNDKNQKLIIGHKTGKVTIYSSNNIKSILELELSQSFSSKQINAIVCDNNYAYCASDFGILKIDINKNEIKETCLIGEKGLETNVYDIKINANQLYAATEEGAKYCNLNANIADFNNWTLFSNDIVTNSLEIINHRVFYTNKFSNSSSLLFYYDIDSKQTKFIENLNNVNRIKILNNDIAIISSQFINLYNEEGELKTKLEFEGLNNMFDIIKVDNLNYIADKQAGLCELSSSTINHIRPNGILYDNIIDINSDENSICAIPNYLIEENKDILPGFSNYMDYNWNNIKADMLPKDINISCIHKIDNSKYIIGTLEGNIIELENTILKEYNSTNTSNSLRNSNIIDIKTDNTGAIWILQDSDSNQLVKYKDNKWEAFTLYSSSIDYTPKKLICLSNSYKMVIGAPNQYIIAMGDIYDYENNTYRNLVRKFYLKSSEQSNQNFEINDIEEDLESSVWIASNKGVLVYNNPNSFFEDEQILAYQPIIESGDNVSYLLAQENINSICINAANQKWFGTKKSGAFLVNKYGNKELLQFDNTNSPINDNNILKIAEIPKTGEIFFLSENELVSYRSSTAKAFNNFKSAYVYPNPVRPNYKGDIIIKGLMDNSIVKITDLNGNLVWEKQNGGGQIVWNGKTLKGNRPATGVYFIFCASDDGENSEVLKLLFIN
ncbi:MAG: hypothetical protein N4A49_10675 [Marinifilaceae bacterium]|jgi:ligand-binding sensor domain-containing protein|nr:hypothetical protein [Marinifilaceae bacterium]